MKQTVTSKYEPKSKNVTWIDMSTGSPVLKNFINGMWRPTGGGGGSTNPDYNVTKQTVTLFNDTVETQQTEGDLYEGIVINVDFDLVPGETYTVVFDDTSYDVKATTFIEQILLGEGDSEGPSFENYPFAIIRGEQGGIKGMMLYTTTEGSHTVVIKHEEETVTTTPEFKDAVDSVTGYSIDTKYSLECENNSFLIPEEQTYFNLGFYEYLDIALSKGATYKITFDGIEYELVAKEDVEFYNKLYIGELSDSANFLPSFENYPFCIQSESDGTDVMFITQQYGTYSVKIESFIESTKTTPAFESMIQGIAGGSTSGCQIIYPDSISWLDTVYSQYNKEPEAGNIYFIPYIDTTDRHYLYPVYIIELINNDDLFSGFATIIGTPVIVDNGTLSVLSFDGVINPSSTATTGLAITYRTIDNTYRLSYKAAGSFS